MLLFIISIIIFKCIPIYTIYDNNIVFKPESILLAVISFYLYLVWISYNNRTLLEIYSDIDITPELSPGMAMLHDITSI